MLEITFAYGLSLLDRAIHHGLREERLIALVVSKPPVTPHVDDNVALERAAEIHRKTDHLRDGFRIFTVHMENRNLKHLCDIACIHARFGFRWRRRETD